MLDNISFKNTSILLQNEADAEILWYLFSHLNFSATSRLLLPSDKLLHYHCNVPLRKDAIILRSAYVD